MPSREMSVLERRVRARLILMGGRGLGDLARGAGLTDRAIQQCLQKGRLTPRVEQAIIDGCAVTRQWVYSGSLEDVGKGLNLICAA